MRKLIIASTLILLAHFAQSQTQTRDIVWQQDVYNGADLYTDLKFMLLRYDTYEAQRVWRDLPRRCRRDIRDISDLYLKRVFSMQTWISRNAKTGPRETQGYAFLDQLIRFQLFGLYPDVHALMINPIHLALDPRVDPFDRDEVIELIDELKPALDESLKLSNKSFLAELSLKVGRAYTDHNLNLIFQADLEASEYAYYAMINSLIWISWQIEQ